MIDIIIESPFLPQRKIKLDETKWTIEKLTSVIAGKIKVLGKSIDKELVKYDLEINHDITYNICKLADYPLCLGSFRNKIVELDKSLQDNILKIRVSFKEEHFSKVRNSIKLLELDTLEHFIERSNKRNSQANIQSIVNLDNNDLTSIDITEPQMVKYTRRYSDYKLSVNSKWTNLLKEMKSQKMIGESNDNRSIKIENVEEPNIENIEEEINRLEDNSANFKSKSKKISRCSCIKRLFKKKVKQAVVKSAFHYNFDDSSGLSGEYKQKSEDDNISVGSDLNYHDENILDDDEIEGKMFYTWDDSNDFLLN